MCEEDNASAGFSIGSLQAHEFTRRRPLVKIAIGSQSDAMLPLGVKKALSYII